MTRTTWTPKGFFDSLYSYGLLALSLVAWSPSGAVGVEVQTATVHRLCDHAGITQKSDQKWSSDFANPAIADNTDVGKPPTSPDLMPPGPAPTPDTVTAEPDFAPSVFDIGSGIGLAAGPAGPFTTIGGYIDTPVIMNRFRFRFDAAYNNNQLPDRAAFFYPSQAGGGPGPGPGPGPGQIERNIDYQDFQCYLEIAPLHRLSVFAELPFRFVNPEINANTSGLADMNAGLKYMLYSNSCDILSFQLRMYAPTGSPSKATGTGLTSLEPGLLYQGQLGERITTLGELKAWIPTTTDPNAGPVLRYGLGAGFDYYQSCDQLTRLSNVIEFVGWTVLDGRASDPSSPNGLPLIDVDGDTIINVKVGGRWTCGRHTAYAGWGHAITGQRWYNDIIRAEYQISF